MTQTREKQQLLAIAYYNMGSQCEFKAEYAQSLKYYDKAIKLMLPIADMNPGLTV